MLKEKLLAVLSLVGEDIDSIDIQDKYTVTIDGREYKVLTDREANDEFEAYQDYFLDSYGINGFSNWAKEYILSNFIDVEWFDQAMRESYEFYIEDIKGEDGRLQEEMEEHGAETEEDYVDLLCEAYNDGIDWYRENFGDEDFANVVKVNGLIDFEKVVEWVKEQDGRGCIASYDNVELEQDGYYIYRMN